MDYWMICLLFRLYYHPNELPQYICYQFVLAFIVGIEFLGCFDEGHDELTVCNAIIVIVVIRLMETIEVVARFSGCTLDFLGQESTLPDGR